MITPGCLTGSPGRRGFGVTPISLSYSCGRGYRSPRYGLVTRRAPTRNPGRRSRRADPGHQSRAEVGGDVQRPNCHVERLARLPRAELHRGSRLDRDRDIGQRPSAAWCRRTAECHTGRGDRKCGFCRDRCAHHGAATQAGTRQSRSQEMRRILRLASREWYLAQWAEPARRYSES